MQSESQNRFIIPSYMQFCRLDANFYGSIRKELKLLVSMSKIGQIISGEAGKTARSSAGLNVNVMVCIRKVAKTTYKYEKNR